MAARIKTMPNRVATADLRRVKPMPPVKPTIAFYGSAEWKALLRRIIATRGRRCEGPQCTTPDRGRGGRIYGHHVIELRSGGAALDANNVRLLCPHCHGRAHGGAGQQQAPVPPPPRRFVIA